MDLVGAGVSVLFFLGLRRLRSFHLLEVLFLGLVQLSEQAHFGISEGLVHKGRVSPNHIWYGNHLVSILGMATI